MTNPTLIIYDNTGRVWGLYGGIDTVPDGVQGIIADAPRSFKSVTIDMTKNPHEAVFEVEPDTEAQIEELQESLTALEARISALEG